MVTVEGRSVEMPVGASAAAALMAAGVRSFRTSALSGTERGPWCMIGVCFDCLAEIDGVPNRQSCMVAVATGMQIRRQHGARAAVSASGGAEGESGPA